MNVEKKKLILEKMASSKQKGKLSVSHGKCMFEREANIQMGRR